MHKKIKKFKPNNLENSIKYTFCLKNNKEIFKNLNILLFKDKKEVIIPNIHTF
jgi:hypothetical protein